MRGGMDRKSYPFDELPDSFIEDYDSIFVFNGYEPYVREVIGIDKEETAQEASEPPKVHKCAACGRTRSYDNVAPYVEGWICTCGAMNFKIERMNERKKLVAMVRYHGELAAKLLKEEAAQEASEPLKV